MYKNERNNYSWGAAPHLVLFAAVLVSSTACPSTDAPARGGSMTEGVPVTILRNDHFLGVWAAGAEGSDLEVEEDFESLEERLEDLAGDGKVIFDLEGGRQIFGVLRKAGQGQAQQRIATGPWADFEPRPNAQPRRLVDVETWEEDGERRYAALWDQEQGPGEAVFEQGLSYTEFFDAYQSHAPTHHLVDFETRYVGDSLELIGVWHPGPASDEPATMLFLGQDLDTFVKSVYELNKLGFRLVEAEYAQVGGDGDHSYSGRWQQAVGDQWFGLDYHLDEFDYANDHLNVQGTSGLVDGKIPDPEPDADQEIVAELLGQSLVDFGIYLRVEKISGFAEHGGATHDGGGADPPGG